MWSNLIILCNILFIKYIIAQDVGEQCVPNKQMPHGTCKLLSNCEDAIKAIRNRNFDQFERCGFEGSQVIVCCPDAENKFGGGDNMRPTIAITQRIADRECEKIISSSTPPLTLHIIGGETASLGEFPHMVALGYDRDEGYKFDCGGALLSSTYVLTAAHCVDTLDRIEPSIVRAGVVEIGSSSFTEDDIRIAEIKKHPNYTRREKYHDLAILRLEKPFQLSSNLNAACLYTSDEDPKIPLTITGWGQTTTTRDMRSNLLLKANVTIVASNKCGESYTNWRKLPQGIASEQLCAGDPEGLKDTCQGDSGGPLQGMTSRDGQYRLIGVTSFGRGCGSPVPGVYTRISKYLDWIENIVWPN